MENQSIQVIRAIYKMKNVYKITITSNQIYYNISLTKKLILFSK
jgi:hypothetical protein